MKLTLSTIAIIACLISHPLAADPTPKLAPIEKGYSVVSGNTVLGTVAQHGDFSLASAADEIDYAQETRVSTLKGHAVVTLLSAGTPVARFEGAELKLVPLK